MSTFQNTLADVARDLDDAETETAVLSTYEPSRKYHKPDCRNATGIEAPKSFLRSKGFTPGDCCHSEGER